VASLFIPRQPKSSVAPDGLPAGAFEPAAA